MPAVVYEAEKKDAMVTALRQGAAAAAVSLGDGTALERRLALGGGVPRNVEARSIHTLSALLGPIRYGSPAAV